MLIKKLKKSFAKLSPISRKIVVALFVATIFIIGLSVTVYTQQVGRSIGFILFFTLGFFAILELCAFLSHNKYLKLIFAFSITAFLLFFPLKNGILAVVDKGWGQHGDDVNNPNILMYIEYAFIFAMFDYDGLGYLFYFFIIALFVLTNSRRNWKIMLYEFLLLFFLCFAIIICVKLIYFWAIYKFTILVIIMCGIIAADTFAYFGGKLLGKGKFDKKLAPKISPNKTWIGAFCGFISSFCLVFFSLYFSKIFIITFQINYNTNLFYSLFFGFMVPIFSILGDLSFSLIKRLFKQKDFSSLIPEHGGILDRFDSTIIVMILFSLLISFPIHTLPSIF